MTYDNKYDKIYNKYRTRSNLINEIYKVIKSSDKNNYKSEYERVVTETTYKVVAPTLVLFVYSTMLKAKDKNISRLYFLARDGYLMFEIAKILNEKVFEQSFDIRYTYCSRISLRRAIYHKFDEYAIELMLSKSKNTTIRGILLGIGFNDNEVENIYNEMNLEHINLDMNLNVRQLEDVKTNLPLIKDKIVERSLAFNKTTIGYFKQEGFFDNIKYAIVDSGWTGSMQETILKIIEDENQNNSSILGYYFGMLKKSDNIPNNNSQSEYNGWYFDDKTKVSRLAKFNINLFESLTIAPHGMTMYYEDCDSVYKPVLKGNKCEFTSEFEKSEYKIILSVAEKISIDRLYNRYDRNINETYLNFVEELLNNLMYSPSYKEAQVYGGIYFSDEPTENSIEPLCKELDRFELSQCILPIKIVTYTCNRLFKNNFFRKSGMPFWVYGSIMITNTKYKKIFRIGAYHTYYLAMLKDKIKRRKK